MTLTVGATFSKFVSVLLAFVQLSASLMTPEQCAEFLGIKINTLYVMKSQGRIPYRKVGHLLRFDFDEIVEWTKDKEK